VVLGVPDAEGALLARCLALWHRLP
jgi:hypothetical protein